MRRLLPLFFFLIFDLGGGAAQAAPYTPQSDDEVLERLPFKASAAEGRQLRQLRRALAEQPQNLERALALARRYFDLAGAEGDPRYVGYAEAAIRPWSKSAGPPAKILIMRALLRQYRHEFDAALADLAQAAERDPASAEIWSWRSAILLVQADYTGARAACIKLAPLASALLATSCNAIIDGRTGKSAQAYAELSRALAQRPDADADLKLWIETRLAETALQLGRDELGLPRDALVLALVGFNLGVEGGQLTIVTAFPPLAYYLRASAFYRRVVLFAGSVAIVAVATVWLLERALNLKLISA